jgi:spore coat protein U-like protein
VRPRILPILAFGLAAAQPALAALTCSGSNASLPFGLYDPFSPVPLDTQATMSVSCTRVTNPPSDNPPAKVTIVVGVGASQTSGSVQNRQLGRVGGGGLLNYNVDLDAGRLSVWGSSPGVDTMSQTLNIPNKATRTAVFTFYGRLFAAQDVMPGTYGDSLIVTVNY